MKKNKLGDLFTMNHRIKKVSVFRDKVKLRDVDLDIENRDLQKIPIEADGGEFKIEIAETVAGSKKEWKEIVVSEMIVVGTPGKDRRPANQPLRITIYDLDGKLTKLPPLRYASGRAANHNALVPDDLEIVMAVPREGAVENARGRRRTDGRCVTGGLRRL